MVQRFNGEGEMGYSSPSESPSSPSESPERDSDDANSSESSASDSEVGKWSGALATLMDQILSGPSLIDGCIVNNADEVC